MEIAIAHSPTLSPSESWIVNVLQNASTYNEVVYRPEDVRPVPVENSAHFNIETFDGLVADFKQPDPELEQMLQRAHSLGKGVLVFLPPNKDPMQYVPSFGEPPQHDTEKRLAYAYWVNPGGVRGNEICVHRRDERGMRLKVWLGSQLIRLGEAAATQEADFKLEIADGKRYGAEADLLPLP